MSLEDGKQLGTYQIVGPLGAGGMGEVFRATDTKLGREVALKVLPDAMARDPERVARFEREAKLLASLNHPQIAAIYGFEQAEGKRFLVLELVEGLTLAERIAAGPLMVEESLDIARQMAEALETAHEKGIIHRDLKPANVKITPDGQVRVLDFGLAKVLADESPEEEPGTSPTITHDLTQPGVIFGTAAYMSPEQARGRAVDKRSDIWSFGCVLYECLTGHSMFLGETVTDSIGAILHKQPDWERLPSDTPPTIQLLLRRCLAKDRKRRLNHIGDVRIELEAAIADPTSSALGLASAALAAEGKSSLLSARGGAAIVGTMLLTLVVTLGIVWSYWPEPMETPPPPPVVATPPPLPVEYSSLVLQQRESALRDSDFSFTLNFSAHDSRLAYVVRNEVDGYDLFIRSQNQALPQKLLTTTYCPLFPTFSPDGQSLVVHEFQQALHRIYTDGRPPIQLCETDKNMGPITGLTWTTDGHILFGRMRRANLLLRVSQNGGAVEEITLPAGETEYPFHVHALPGGQAVLYTASKSRFYRGEGSIRVYSFQTKESTPLIEDGDSPVYMASGHLLFLRGSTLMAAPFDTQALLLTGPAVPVMQGIDPRGFWNSAVISVTVDGMLYYHQGEDRNRDEKQIYQFDLDGKQQQQQIYSPETGLFRGFAISPDGESVALSIRDDAMSDKSSIGVLDRQRDVLTPLTRKKGIHRNPFFSPDGQWIYYSAFDDELEWRGVFRRRADGSDSEELVDDGLRPCYVESITKDGKHLLVEERPSPDHSPGTSWDLAVIHLGEDGEKATREPWLGGSGRQVNPRISPNGRWVAYGDIQGRTASAIYVRLFSGEGAEFKVSRENGRHPFWSAEGDALYFRARSAGKRVVMKAQVISGAEAGSDNPSANFKAAAAELLLNLPPEIWRFSEPALMPDGKSFLVIGRAAPADGEIVASTDDPAVIHVVRNFFTELERVAPTKNKTAEK